MYPTGSLAETGSEFPLLSLHQNYFTVGFGYICIGEQASSLGVAFINTPILKEFIYIHFLGCLVVIVVVIVV
jgi:hypothetical protein